VGGFVWEGVGAGGGKGWRGTGLVVRVGRTMVGMVVMWKFEKEIEKKFRQTTVPRVHYRLQVLGYRYL